MDKSLHQMPGGESPSNVHLQIVDNLGNIELTGDWQKVEDLPDDFNGKWEAGGGWGRIINGKKVFVIHAHEGEHNAKWRLFIDGEYVREIDTTGQMGSAKEAMGEIDEELKA